MKASYLSYLYFLLAINSESAELPMKITEFTYSWNNYFYRLNSSESLRISFESVSNKYTEAERLSLCEHWQSVIQKFKGSHFFAACMEVLPEGCSNSANPR